MYMYRSTLVVSPSVGYQREDEQLTQGRWCYGNASIKSIKMTRYPRNDLCSEKV